MANNLEYIHLQTGEDILCIAGYYTPAKEVRLKYNNREVLYVVGQAVIESSCCGTGHWEYALVPGYVVSWQSRTNEAGLPVSRVEPIRDKAVQDDISRTLKETESVSQVEFW
ncbi:hypothetical protein ACFLTL_00090 [Chloroflexota bacterium]